MKKFPKVKYPNDPETDGLWNDKVVVTEKYDGANFRFSRNDGVWTVGTRNVVYENPFEDDNFPNAFKHALRWLHELPKDTVDALDGAGTFFGEAMHLHSLDYAGIDWENPDKGSPHVPLDSKYPNVVLFDWWTGDNWADWDEFESFINAADLPAANVIGRGDKEFLEDNGALDIPETSEFGGQPEGIMARRVDGQVRAKKVSEDFREKNSQAFNDPSKAQGDAAEFVAMFVTPARVTDNAHDLVDEGEYEGLQMEMMEQLPATVLKDILAEEGWNLFCDEYGFECTFDDEFKSEVRSKTSKKCARVLKQELKKF